MGPYQKILAKYCPIFSVALSQSRQIYEITKLSPVILTNTVYPQQI